MRFVSVLSALLLMAGNVAVPAQRICSPVESGTCTYVTRPVSETPAGRIDGQNVSFVLSASPAPNTPVRGFSNGIELTPGGDYQLAGANITFVRGHAPISGDVLNFFYYEIVGMGTLKTSSATARGTVQPSATSDLIAQVLRRALAYEATQEQSPTNPSAASGPSAGLSGSRAAANTREVTSRGDESLRMLFRSIQSRAVVKGKRGRKLPPDAVQGVDGMGDHGPDSIFSLLDGNASNGSNPSRAISGLGALPRDTSAADRSEPPSLRMLADRIARSESRDPANR